MNECLLPLPISLGAFSFLFFSFFFFTVILHSSSSWTAFRVRVCLIDCWIVSSSFLPCLPSPESRVPTLRSYHDINDRPSAASHHPLHASGRPSCLVYTR